MSTDNALTTPRLRVVMDDGSCRELRALNVDLVAWDRERGRHRDWPAAQDAPFLWSTYLAWHILRRTGQTAVTLPEFEATAQEVSMLEDDAGDDAVDPTRTDPVAG